jgi:hypothetical protein
MRKTLRWTGIRAPFDLHFAGWPLNAGFIDVHVGAGRYERGAQAAYERLTMTACALLKKNHIVMNKRFLAAVVKILAPVFTNPMMVVDLLWRARGRLR